MKEVSLYDLSLYLPYNVAFIDNDEKKQGVKILYGVDPQQAYPINKDQWLPIRSVRMLLRPLEQLNAFLDNYYEDFTPANKGIIYHDQREATLRCLRDKRIRTHEELEWLLERHFDVNELIKDNLAYNLTDYFAS